MKSVLKVGIIALLYPIWIFLFFLHIDSHMVMQGGGILSFLLLVYILTIIPAIIVAIIFVIIERAKIFRKRNTFLSACLYLIASSVISLVVLTLFVFVADRGGPSIQEIEEILPVFIFTIIQGFLSGLASLIIPPRHILVTSRSSRPEGRMLLSNIFV